MRIFDLFSVLVAKLLSELDCAGRTNFNALAAGYAAFLIDVCGIRASRKVGRIEKHRGTERVADFDVAVADIENLFRAVDIGYLMHVAVLFRKLENFKRTLFINVMRATRFNGVIRHIADLYTPVVHVVGTAVAEHCARRAAGADTSGQMSVVFLQPVRNMLDIERFVLGVYSLLNGNDVHTDTVASRRYHLRNARERDKRHTLEEVCNRRIILNALDG